MRNPSWCTPEQSLHHLCKQSTYCFFQELISSWVSGCQAYTLRPKASQRTSQRTEERQQRERDPNKHWLTPSPSSGPAQDIFIFLSASHPSLAPSTGMAWPEPNHQVTRGSWHSSYFFLKYGGGMQNYPENIPHYFFIPSSLKITLSPSLYLCFWLPLIWI